MLQRFFHIDNREFFITPADYTSLENTCHIIAFADKEFSCQNGFFVSPVSDDYFTVLWDIGMPFRKVNHGADLGIFYKDVFPVAINGPHVQDIDAAVLLQEGLQGDGADFADLDRRILFVCYQRVIESPPFWHTSLETVDPGVA